MRITLAWELGGGMGHLARLDALARPLVGAGHDVRVVTASPHGGRFAGCEVVAAPPRRELPIERRVRPTRTWVDILHNAAWATGLAEYADAWADALRGADVFVADYAPTAVLAARGLGVRCVTTSNGFTRPPDRSPPPDLLDLAGLGSRGVQPWASDASSSTNAGMNPAATCLRDANAWLSSRGGPPLPRLSAVFAGAPDVRTTFPEFDHYGPRDDGTYVGPLPQPPGVAPDWPDGEGPRGIAYLKVTPAVAKVLGLLGVSGMRWRVHLRGATPRGLPADVRATREPFDVPSAAAGADVAVCHAGPGFSTAALLAGVPLVLLPGHLEQQIFARRLATAGLAAVASPDDPASFRDALVRVLTDDSFATAAAAFAARHRDHDPRAALRAACGMILAG